LAVAIISFIFGLTVGNILMVQPLLVGAAFGMRDYPRLLGSFQLLMNFGVALGPILIGVIYDASAGGKGYERAFLAIALSAFCAALAMARAGAPEDATR
jgi:MFS family permease